MTWHGVTPQSREVIEYIKGRFPIDKEATGDFKFTGHEVTQDESFNIRVRCKDTTRKMGNFNINTGLKGSQRKATPG